MVSEEMNEREKKILSLRIWSEGILDEHDIEAVKMATSLNDVQHIFQKIDYNLPYDCLEKNMCRHWVRWVIECNVQAAFENLSI